MVSRITVYSTYIDSTIARPLMTTFGGTCCSPSALRSRLSTTTILVNEVTITAPNGASARLTTVIRTSAGSRLLKSLKDTVYGKTVEWAPPLADGTTPTGRRETESAGEGK